ncbi:MAG: hypothetical protein SNJ71_01265 [Bacteroidales bacterium]
MLQLSKENEEIFCNLVEIAEQNNLKLPSNTEELFSYIQDFFELEKHEEKAIKEILAEKQNDEDFLFAFIILIPLIVCYPFFIPQDDILKAIKQPEKIISLITPNQAKHISNFILDYCRKKIKTQNNQNINNTEDTEENTEEESKEDSEENNTDNTSAKDLQKIMSEINQVSEKIKVASQLLDNEKTQQLLTETQNLNTQIQNIKNTIANIENETISLKEKLNNLEKQIAYKYNPLPQLKIILVICLISYAMTALAIRTAVYTPKLLSQVAVTLLIVSIIITLYPYLKVYINKIKIKYTKYGSRTR